MDFFLNIIFVVNYYDFLKHTLYVFKYIGMFQLMDFFHFFIKLCFLSTNNMWFGKFYIGTFVAKNKVQAKYYEITSNFKMILGL
jgi:hypothetical protein